MAKHRIWSTEDIRSHPRFREAVDDLMDGLVDLGGIDPLSLRWMFEYERAVSLMIAASFAFLHDEDNPESWMTLPRLRAALAQMQITQHRKVTDMVSAMRRDGLLSAQPAQHDRRTLILRPTEFMIRLDREWMSTFHRPLLCIIPDDRIARGAAGDPAYHRMFRIIGTQTLDRANEVIPHNPVARFFIQENGGFRILGLLMQAVRGRDDGRTDAGFYSKTAERAGVSRVHIRNILRKAADLGFVRLSSPPGRYVEVTAETRDWVDIFAAESLEGIEHVSKMTFEALRGSATG